MTMPKDNRANVGGLRRDEWIAETGSTVSSPKTQRILDAAAAGMRLSVLAVRFNVPPRELVKLLKLDTSTVRGQDELYAAESAFYQAREVMSNPVRSTGNANMFSDEVMSNPCRPNPRRS